MKKNSPILRFFFIILLFQLPASLFSQEMVKGDADNRFIYGIPDSLITVIQDAMRFFSLPIPIHVINSGYCLLLIQQKQI